MGKLQTMDIALIGGLALIAVYLLTRPTYQAPMPAYYPPAVNVVSNPTGQVVSTLASAAPSLINSISNFF
jgi:hypothetical protein